MRKCANISPYMRRPLVIYDFATLHSDFPYTVYEENLIFFFISVGGAYNTTLIVRVIEGT